MRPDEFVAWRSRSVADLVEDLRIMLRLDPAEAREQAEAQFARALPDGMTSENTHLLVAEDAAHPGSRVGVLWLHVADSDDAFVAELVIDENLRGRGFGRAAMQAAEDFVVERGATGLALHVFGHNEAAKSLYSSLGYHVTSQNMRKGLTAT